MDAWVRATDRWLLWGSRLILAALLTQLLLTLALIEQFSLIEEHLSSIKGHLSSMRKQLSFDERMPSRLSSLDERMASRFSLLDDRLSETEERLSEKLQALRTMVEALIEERAAADPAALQVGPARDIAVGGR